MARIKLVLEYDGSDYVGWQVQPNGVSIQQRVELALEQLLTTGGGWQDQAGGLYRGVKRIDSEPGCGTRMEVRFPEARTHSLT